MTTNKLIVFENSRSEFSGQEEKASQVASIEAGRVCLTGSAFSKGRARGADSACPPPVGLRPVWFNKPLNYKQKEGKISLWAFSFFDWAFIGVGLVLIAFLIVYPFLNNNNQAIVYLIQKKHEKAENKWRKALEQKPFSSLYRLNLALNYQLGRQTAKSLQEYQVVQNFFLSNNREKTGERNLDRDFLNPMSITGESSTTIKTNSQYVFYSFFNSAVVETQKNHIQQALQFYQEALAFEPHSLEVKTNIELLTKKSQGNKKSGKSKQKNQEQQGQEGQEGQQEGQQGQEEQQGDQDQEGQQEGQEEQEGQQGDQEQQGQEEQDKEGQEGQQERQDEEGQEVQQGDQEQQGQEGQDQKEQQGQEGQQGAQEQKDQQGQEGQQGDQEQQGQEQGQLENSSESQKPSTGHASTANPLGKNQNLDSAQIEAILQAISDQEQQIKKRRQRRRKTPSPKEKDW